MRNFLYLNADGMVNVHPEINTVQINEEYYCEMSEPDFQAYIKKNDLKVINGTLLDNEDGYQYGIVLIKV